MVDYKSVSMPVDTQAKVSTMFGPPVADPTHFRSLVGALQYLTFTHPNIAYAIQQIFSCDALPPPSCRSTLMQIGWVARTHVGLPQATLCSSVPTSSCGL
jgi:hypothetical protein